MKAADVRMESSSSSSVVAPSHRPEMVRVATRIGSTPPRPSAHRSTARTILLTSTGSRSPLRLRTLMVVDPLVSRSVPPTRSSVSAISLPVLPSRCPAGAFRSADRRQIPLSPIRSARPPSWGRRSGGPVPVEGWAGRAPRVLNCTHVITTMSSDSSPIGEIPRKSRVGWPVSVCPGWVSRSPWRRGGSPADRIRDLRPRH